jgi:hypothetical protein
MSSIIARCNLRLAAYVVLGVIFLSIAALVYQAIAGDNESTESFLYNKYDRAQIARALSTEELTKLSLREYIYIMNSSYNLQTLSLQELCGNYILGCDTGVQLRTVADVHAWAGKVAGAKIIQCVERGDWFRLAMILLKMFDSVCAVDKNYEQWFERSPTNGVFGVESIRMMKNGELFPLYQLPPIPPIDSDRFDATYVEKVYRPFKKDLIRLIECNQKAAQTDSNKCKLLTVETFCKLGCVMARDLFRTNQ